MKKKVISQKKEIIYNLVNSGLAGILVLLGAFTTGEITATGISAAIVASSIVAISQFKDFWDSEKKEYCRNVFTFVHI